MFDTVLSLSPRAAAQSKPDADPASSGQDNFANLVATAAADPAASQSADAKAGEAAIDEAAGAPPIVKPKKILLETPDVALAPPPTLPIAVATEPAPAATTVDAASAGSSPSVPGTTAAAPPQGAPFGGGKPAADVADASSTAGAQTYPAQSSAPQSAATQTQAPAAATATPQQAVAAALAAAGVTSITGETVTDGPTLAKPAAPKPVAPGEPAKTASAAKEEKSGTTTAAASVVAGKSASDAIKPASKSDAAAGNDGSDLAQAQQAQQASPDAAAPTADRGAPMVQTAAAPATPSAQNAQVSGSAALAAAHVAAQVATDIAHAAGTRRTRFEIRLDPDELGRIDVRLDIQHDGRIATRLIVEKAETLDMLKQDSRELQRQLEQSGFQLGQGGLAFQLKDGRRDDWRSLADMQGLNAAPSAPDSEDVAPAADIYARSARRGASGVDMTV